MASNHSSGHFSSASGQGVIRVGQSPLREVPRFVPTELHIVHRSA